VIARTVTTDHIISLEDGKPYRSLKRHLASRGLTEGQYRAKWGLPPDYPMVAPSFSAQRAQQIHDRTAAKHQAAMAKDDTPKVKTTGRKAKPAGAAHHAPVPAWSGAGSKPSCPAFPRSRFAAALPLALRLAIEYVESAFEDFSLNAAAEHLGIVMHACTVSARRLWLRRWRP
jgi:hypothetical protein